MSRVSSCMLHSIRKHRISNMPQCKLVLLVLGTMLLQGLCDDVSPKFKFMDKSSFKKSMWKECASSYSIPCFKLDVISWVDKLNEEDTINLLPGVSLVREESGARSSQPDIVAELARDFPNDPSSRLDAFLLKRITGFLNSHSIKLNFFNQNEDVETGRGKGGGGGGGGGKKGGGGGHGHMILAAGAMMKGMLMALALGGITAIAGKALITGLISLLISGIIGIKALTHQEKKTTYEVVSKPIYTHSQTHSESHEPVGHVGHSSYGRSFDIPEEVLRVNPEEGKPPVPGLKL